MQRNASSLTIKLLDTCPGCVHRPHSHVVDAHAEVGLAVFKLRLISRVRDHARLARVAVAPLALELLCCLWPLVLGLRQVARVRHILDTEGVWQRREI